MFQLLRTPRRSARQLWLLVHRWLGLALLLLSIPLGLTGSANVYHREIDRWLHPNFYEPVAQGEPLPLKRILEIVRDQDPAPVISMILPDDYWPVVLIHQRHGPEVWRTSIDPVSGAILGRRDQTHALMPTLYRLHQELLLKPYWGEEMVGVAGLALTLSCVSGLWLWWPKPRRLWRSITVQSGQSQYKTGWELHAAMGFWSCLVMTLVALSGTVLAFPNATARILGLVSPVRHFGQPRLESAVSRPPDDPDSILRVARAHRPQDVALVIGLPTKRSNAWRVAMRPASRHGVVGGMTQLWVDPWKLEVVQEKSDAQASTGDWLMACQFPLHNGSLLGEPGRVLAFLSGFAFPLLAFTGAYLWWHKRQLQRRATLARRQRRSTESSQPENP